MLPLQFKGKVWFYRKPIDFRKQLWGLVQLLAGDLDQSPTDGSVYVFRNKGYDRIKLLVWDKNGFWLLYKILEQGHFQFPNPKEGEMILSQEQFQWLLSGLDISNQTIPEKVTATSYV